MPSLILQTPILGELLFVATLRVDSDSTAQSAVWLDRQDGTRWALRTPPGGPWASLSGRQVQVQGVLEPSAEASADPTADPAAAVPVFVASSVSLVDAPPEVEPVWVGAATTLRGQFSLRTGEEGSKLAGEQWTVFVAQDGQSWLILGGGAAPQALGQAVQVGAWPVERTPYVAHMGGQTLWIGAVSALPTPQ